MFDLTFVHAELIWAVDGINKQLGVKKGPQVYTGKRYGLGEASEYAKRTSQGEN